MSSRVNNHAWPLARARSRVNGRICGGSRESCAKPDWQLERTGFEPPRPVDSAVVDRGFNPLAMNWPHLLVADAIQSRRHALRLRPTITHSLKELGCLTVWLGFGSWCHKWEQNNLRRCNGDRQNPRCYLPFLTGVGHGLRLARVRVRLPAGALKTRDGGTTRAMASSCSFPSSEARRTGRSPKTAPLTLR